MKLITIHRLRLENFKCHRLLEMLPFGQSMELRGGNGVGKSAVRDALFWLLYGQPEAVQPRGEADAVTAVECEFRLDESLLTLRRTLQTRWTMRMGCREPVRAGQCTGFEIDGVAVGRGAYEAFVRELIHERIFRLLSEPGYFTGLPWPRQRALLLAAAGVDEDREAQRRKLAVREQDLLTARSDHAVRLGECRRILEDLKGTDCGAEIAAVENRIAALRADAKRTTAQLMAIHEQRQALEVKDRAALDAAQEALNARLKSVQVQLYRMHRNGIEAQCVLLVDGLALKQAGTGARIRAETELIGLLSQHFGISIPLFLDHAEALTQPLPTQNQCIRLIAEKGALRIKSDGE